MSGTLARTLVPDSVPAASYDPANRQPTFGDTSLTFDDNGNLVSLIAGGQPTTYTWDARNRLTGIGGPLLGATFAYDALGGRAGKTINGQATTFQYDGLDVTLEDGATGLASYLRTLGIDEALTRTDNATSLSYLADALGSTVALADANGATPTSYTYAPFGETAGTDATANPVQFTGRENDGTGLYYYRARYYDPVRSRFVQEDPLSLAGGYSNLYRYGVNPLGWVDPNGLLSFSAFGGASFRVDLPLIGGEANLGFRVGTDEGGEENAVAGYASARAFPANGLAAGRGTFVGVAFRDVSELSRLIDITIDTPLFPVGSLSILYDSRGFAGVQIGGPTPLAGMGVGGPGLDYWSWEKIIFKVPLLQRIKPSATPRCAAR